MRTRFLLTVVIASVGVAICNQGAVAASLEIIRSIDFPAADAAGTGIAWDGQHLWATMWDPVNGRLTYELDPADGSVVSSFEPLGPGTYAGHTWDGTHLWITENPPDGFPDYIHKLSTDGTVAESFLAPNSPDAYLTGAAWDGSYLWVSDPLQREIMQVDPLDMTVLTSFAFPFVGGALAWDGSHLWCLSGGNRAVFQLDTSGNVLETWSLPDIIAFGNPAGLAFDDEHFWILANGETPAAGVTIPARIYQVAIPEPASIVLLATGAISVIAFARGWRHTNPEIR